MSGPLPLAGRVAIVTGSSRGIGAAIIERLAKLGANVVVNYLSKADVANALVATINADRNSGAAVKTEDTPLAVAAIAVQADAATIAGGQKMLTECLKAFGRVDFLVLNAGLLLDCTLAELDESIFDKAFNIHLKGPLFLAKAVAEHLGDGGRIIFISSLVTKKSTILPYGLIQCASKGAIEQVSRILAKDLGPRGITVNTVSPGLIDTPGLRAAYSEHKLQFIANIHPMKRMGQGKDISSLVAFLMTEDAEWISGQNIGCNGGLIV